MHAAGEGEVGTASEKAIAVAEHAELEYRNQRYFGGAGHAHRLRVADNPLRRDVHRHRDNLSVQSCVWSGLNWAPHWRQRRCARICRSRRNRGYVIARRIADGRVPGWRIVAHGTDLRGGWRLNILECRGQVRSHLFHGAFGGTIGVIIAEIGRADLLLGIHHHHQSDGEPGQQQRQQEGRDQCESS